ncbi:MAG: MATE family efflux transporter [Acetobacteraceae bacterium]|nr:MATE family efflux transporter [Acetobacteraceae bacterium]
MDGTLAHRAARAAAPKGRAWAAEARATIALAWPIVLTNLSGVALLLTDTMIVGRLGAEALAAVTIATNLYWAVQAPTFGIALAAAPLLAQARGAARRSGGPRRGWMREMRRSARQALWAVMALTLPTWALLWHAEALLLGTGQEPAIAAMAADYLRAFMWGMPFFGAFIVLRGFLAAMEQPGPALLVAFGGVGANALLVWALVFGAFGAPRLGVAGAGLASFLVNLLMPLALLGLIARDRRLRRFRLLGRLWRPDWPRFREVFRVGLPIAGQMWLEIGLFAGAALVVGRLGAVPVAAHAVAVQMATATFMVPLGIGQAATARVGLAAGAGDMPGAALAGSVAVALGTAFMAMTAAGMVAGSGVLPWLFLGAGDPDAPAVAALGATLLVIAGLFQLADGVQVVAAGALRGLRDTRAPMLFAALGYWGIGLPVGLLLAFPLGFGASGIWTGLATGLLVVAALLLRRWRRLAGTPLPAG